MEKKEYHNFLWYCLDAITSLVTALVVGGQVAQHLGSTAFGELSYQWALIIVISQFGALGLDLVVFREVANQPEHSRAILYRSLRLRMAGGCLALSIALLFLPLGQAEIGALALVCAVAMPCEVFFIYFSARLQAKRVCLIRSLTRLLGGIVRLALIHFGAGIPAFLLALGVEHALAGTTAAALGSRSVRREQKTGPETRDSLLSSTALLREALPLSLLPLANAAYNRLDLLMLRHLGGPMATGHYAVATRFINVPLFLPAAMASSLMPRMGRLHQEKRDAYRSLLLRVLRWHALLAYGLILLILLPVFGWLVTLLFGADFKAAILLAQVLALSWIFHFSGIAREMHLRLEKSNRLLLVSLAIGLTANVLLNAWFIPQWGAYGAAVATILSLLIAKVLTSLLFSRYRWLGLQQLYALVTPLPRHGA